MQNFCLIQFCVVVELFSLKNACGFTPENASYYVRLESGFSIRKVNTVNIVMMMSETDDSVINFEMLCCCWL